MGDPLKSLTCVHCNLKIPIKEIEQHAKDFHFNGHNVKTNKNGLAYCTRCRKGEVELQDKCPGVKL